MADTKLKFNVEGIDNELVKKTVLTYIGVIFLAMVAILFVLPRVSDLLLVRKNVNNENSKIVKINDSFSVLDQFETRVGKNNIDLIDVALPANFDPGLILSELRILSNNHDVTISSYSLNGGEINSGDGDKNVLSKRAEGEASKPQGSRSTEFDLMLSGSADKLILFMEELEKSFPLTRISEVKASEIVSVIKETESENRVNLSLKINYYYFPYQKILGSNLTTLDEYLILSDDLLVLSGLSSYNKPVKRQSAGMTGGGNGNLFAVD